MVGGVDVKAFMSGEPVSLEPEASALEALELMSHHGIRHLPVLDGHKRVVGVLSIDDLRAALPFSVHLDAAPSPRERELAREWSVAELMTHAPETVGEDTALSEAAQTMATRRIGCLPVVDAEGCLTGILSETDVLYALATTLWTDELRARRAEGTEIEIFVTALRRERAAISARNDPSDERAARRLHGLDRALAHAAQGRLGICEDCGGRIPLTRLRALPGTTRCMACAARG